MNPDLGTDEELELLHGRLREKGMAMLVDWVPNHMATGQHNPLWMDVLSVGSPWWETTRVILPAHLDRARFRDQLTGRAVAVTSVAGNPGVMVADCFHLLPVALLEWRRGAE